MIVADSEVKQNNTHSRYRYVILYTFCLISFSNVLPFVSYVPIWSSAAIYYNITDADLQWQGNAYYITFLAFSHFFNKMLIWNLNITLQLSQLLSAVGALILWLGGPSFMLSLIAYFILGIAESMFYQVPMYLTKQWFFSDQRLQSTSIGAFSNYVGIAFSYGFSSLFFQGLIDQGEINTKIETLNMFIAILNCSCFAITLFTLLKQPSMSSQELQTRDGLWISYKKIFSQEEQIYDILSLAYFLALGWYYLTLVSLQLYQYGYTQQQILITGTIASASGVIVGFYASYKLDQQTKKGFQPDYDNTLRIIFSLGFWALIIEALFIEDLPYAILLILNFFIGVGLNGTYPIMLEALMEKFYPTHELVLISVVVSIACIIGVMMNFLLLLNSFIDYGLWIACFLLVPPYGHLLVRYETQYKRFEQEG